MRVLNRCSGEGAGFQLLLHGVVCVTGLCSYRRHARVKRSDCLPAMGVLSLGFVFLGFILIGSCFGDCALF